MDIFKAAAFLSAVSMLALLGISMMRAGGLGGVKRKRMAGSALPHEAGARLGAGAQAPHLPAIEDDELLNLNGRIDGGAEPDPFAFG